MSQMKDVITEKSSQSRRGIGLAGFSPPSPLVFHAVEEVPEVGRGIYVAIPCPMNGLSRGFSPCRLGTRYKVAGRVPVSAPIQCHSFCKLRPTVRPGEVIAGWNGSSSAGAGEHHRRVRTGGPSQTAPPIVVGIPLFIINTHFGDPSSSLLVIRFWPSHSAYSTHMACTGSFIS